MKRESPVREAMVFLSWTLGLTFLVFWGPLAVFGVQTFSFVDDTVGPAWAIPLFILGGFVPSLVALTLTAVKQGRQGVGALLRRVVQFRLGRWWYLAIAFIVVAGTGGQILVIWALGQTFDFRLFLTQLGSAVPLIVLGPLSEELGWRGYALDRLLDRWSAFSSSLCVGVAWGLWHLPLFFMVGTSQYELQVPFWSYLIGPVALSFVFTWLYVNTGRSIWSAVFFHWLYTYSAQVVFTGVERTPLYNALEYVPYLVVAAVVVLVSGPKRWFGAPSVVDRTRGEQVHKV